MSAGKGSSPRNMGPKFRENYDAIFRKKPFTLRPKGLSEEEYEKRLGEVMDSVGRELRKRRENSERGRTVSPHPEP